MTSLFDIVSQTFAPKRDAGLRACERRDARLRLDTRNYPGTTTID